MSRFSKSNTLNKREDFIMILLGTLILIGGLAIKLAELMNDNL